MNYKFWFWLGIAALAFLLVGVFVSYNNYFQACLADGYKNWECSAMLNGGGRWR